MYVLYMCMHVVCTFVYKSFVVNMLFTYEGFVCICTQLRFSLQRILTDFTHTHAYGLKTTHTCALAETRPAHWVIVLHLGLEGCSQPRELWFVDILMRIFYNIHVHVHL